MGQADGIRKGGEGRLVRVSEILTKKRGSPLNWPAIVVNFNS